jgi:hypothetical protein
MSEILQIKCDAPKCGTIKLETNKWFILRRSSDGAFKVESMHDSEKQSGDQHICSSTCLHAVLEAWIQSKTDVAAPVEEKGE